MILKGFVKPTTNQLLRYWPWLNNFTQGHTTSPFPHEQHSSTQTVMFYVGPVRGASFSPWEMRLENEGCAILQDGSDQYVSTEVMEITATVP